MPEIIAEQLATAIREERRRQGLTQPELALAAGISVRALRQVEKGKSTARIDIVARLLDALDLAIAIQQNRRFAEASSVSTGATGPSIAAFDGHRRRERRDLDDSDE